MGNVVMPIWNDAPAATRHFVVAYPILSLTFAITGFWSYVACVPSTTIYEYYFHLQSLVFSCFMRPIDGGMGFLMILLEMWMMLQTFGEKEKELGSAAFIWWLAFTNFCISTLFVAVAFVLGLVIKSFMHQTHAGVWAIIVMNISQRSTEYPETEVNFWGFPIKYKFVPFVLVALNCIMAQALLLDMFSAITVGLLYKRLRLDYFNLRPNASMKFEKLFPCCRIWRHGGPWLAPPTGGGFMQGLYNDLSNFAGQQVNVPLSQRAQDGALFSGEGVRLGEGPPQSLIQGPVAAVAQQVAEVAEGKPAAARPESPQASGREEENVQGNV